MNDDPWKIDPLDPEVIEFPDGEYLDCASYTGDLKDDRERARRIVAAVNALAGVPTEVIEGGTVRNLILAAMGAPIGGAAVTDEWREGMSRAVAPFRTPGRDAGDKTDG